MPYSKVNSKANEMYNALKADLKKGQLGTCYIFHGEEKYLMQHSIARIREMLCPDGTDSFNYKRFNSSNISARLLDESVEMLPFAGARTLIEVHDFDIFKSDEREEICKLIADLPGHVCLVFVHSTTEFKPDGRLKLTKETLPHVRVVEFAPQEEGKIADWIMEHFRRLDRQISRSDALYMLHITGGLMTTLHSEINKVAAYVRRQQVTRGDIDAVVVPVLDAVSYMLTDAIVKGKHRTALQLLDKLIAMREPPHKLLFSISMKMRQLLAARVCIDSKAGKKQFMKMCGIHKEYPADILMNTARGATLSYCRSAVLLCAATAKELNSTGQQPEACIIELTAKLAMNKR